MLWTKAGKHLLEERAMGGKVHDRLNKVRKRDGIKDERERNMDRLCMREVERQRDRERERLRDRDGGRESQMWRGLGRYKSLWCKLLQW